MAILTAKIIAMALMGIFTLFFGLLPLKVKSMILKGEAHSRQRRKREFIISALLCFGSGVLIATVFVHMIPEAREGFERSIAVLNKRHSEALTSPSHTKQDHHDGEDGHSHDHGKEDHLHDEKVGHSNKNIGMSHEGEHDHNHDHGKHEHKEESTMPTNSQKHPVKEKAHDHDHKDDHDHTGHGDANQTDEHKDHDHKDVHDHAEHVNANQTDDHDHHETNEKMNATATLHGQHGHENHGHDAHLDHDEHDHEMDSLPEASANAPENVIVVSHTPHDHDHEHDEVAAHNNDNIENGAHPHESQTETHPHEHDLHDHTNEDFSSNTYDTTTPESITHKPEMTDTSSQPQEDDHNSESDTHDHAHMEHTNPSALVPQNVEETTTGMETSDTNSPVEHSNGARRRRSAFVREDLNDTHTEGEDEAHENHTNESSAHDDHAHENRVHVAHAHDDHDGHAHGDHDDHGHGYPFAEFTVCIGFFLIYTLEEVLHKILFRHSHNSENNNKLDKSSNDIAEDGHHHNHHHHHSHIPPFHSHSDSHTKGDTYSSAPKNQSNGHAVTPRNVQETTFKTMSPRSEWGVQGVENPVFAGDIEATSWNPKLRNSITLSQVAPISSSEVQVRSFGAPSTPPPKLEAFPEISKDEARKKGTFSHILTNIRSLLIIVALSFHSIFEGMAVGLQEVNMDVWYLFLAIAAHKFVIVFCIGLELLEAKTPLALMILYMFVLALVTPIGIGISIIITENSSFGGAEHTLIIAVLQGMAGGTLLYVAFLEILERERSKPGGRLIKLISLFLGFALMASLEAASGGHSHAPIEGH